MIRLTSVDLPTFGRPTTASTGAGGAASSPAAVSAKSVGVHSPELRHRRPASSCRALTSFSVARRDPRPARPARPGWSRWPPPARPGRCPRAAVNGSPTSTSTRGRNRRRTPAGRRVPRHDDRQHDRPAGAGQPGRARAARPRRRRRRGCPPGTPRPARRARSTDSACVSGRRSAAPRRTASWPMRGSSPTERPVEHLLLDQEHRAPPEQPEEQGPVDERAVVGDDDDRTLRRDPVAMVEPQPVASGGRARCRSSGRRSCSRGHAPGGGDRIAQLLPRPVTAAGPRGPPPGRRQLGQRAGRRRRGRSSVSSTTRVGGGVQRRRLCGWSRARRGGGRRRARWRGRRCARPCGPAPPAARRGPRLGRGEVDLERGVREHDAADVAALHDDPPVSSASRSGRAGAATSSARAPRASRTPRSPRGSPRRRGSRPRRPRRPARCAAPPGRCPSAAGPPARR